jgi:hypothetical protein|tara:strand:+ start:1253 stop:1684 length:432 start_codon:yes stop_codon:yes gene_type:complete
MRGRKLVIDRGKWDEMAGGASMVEIAKETGIPESSLYEKKRGRMGWSKGDELMVCRVLGIRELDDLAETIEEPVQGKLTLETLDEVIETARENASEINPSTRECLWWNTYNAYVTRERFTQANCEKYTARAHGFTPDAYKGPR